MSSIKSIGYIYFWMLSSVSPIQAVAQIPDPSQELQLQQQREQALQRQLLPQQDKPLHDWPLPPSNADGRFQDEPSPCFPIHTLLLADGTDKLFPWLLTHAQRDRAGQPDPIQGHCSAAGNIQRIIERLQNVLVAQGYVTARVLMPAQDLKTGVLTVTIVPGRIQTIRLENATGQHAMLRNAFPLQTGRLLNLRHIEQGLENLRHPPSADVDIQIIPAQDNQQPGYSDLVVHYRRSKPYRIMVNLDNGGSKSTGQYQGSFTFSYDHLLHLNDLFYFSHHRDLGGGEPGKRGSQGSTAYFAIPWGWWKLNLGYSGSDYIQSVAGASQDYLYRGTSQQAHVQLSRVVWRNSRHKLRIQGKAFLRRSSNYIDDTEVQVQRRRTAGWEVGMEHRTYIRQSVIDASLSYQRGTGAWGAVAAPEQNFGEGTARYKTIQADLRLHIPWNVGHLPLHYSGQWRGQFNHTPLTPNERFSIGGRYTVRGFDGEHSLMGDRGWLLRNELALGQSGQQIYLAIDHGRVDGPSAQWLSGHSLAGAAVGAKGNLKGVAYDVFVGKPLHRPDGFQTANAHIGFNLNYQF